MPKLPIVPTERSYMACYFLPTKRPDGAEKRPHLRSVGTPRR